MSMNIILGDAEVKIIIALLDEPNSLQPVEIARLTELSPQSVSMALKKLMRKGVVRKSTKKVPDKRARFYSLNGVKLKKILNSSHIVKVYKEVCEIEEI